MTWEPKSFDDSFEAALARGWSLDFISTLSIWILGACPVLVRNVTPPQLAAEPDPWVRYLTEAVGRLTDGAQQLVYRSFQEPDEAGARYAAVEPTPVGKAAYDQLRAQSHFYEGREAQFIAACDITLAHVAVVGGIPERVRLPNVEKSRFISVGEAELIWRVRYLHVAGRLISPALFDRAHSYLRQHELIESPGYGAEPWLTDSGRRAMEEFGGSTTEYPSAKVQE